MHELTIETDGRARYPHKAVCSCGWESWGYLTTQAAANVGQDHVDKGEGNRDGYWGGVAGVPSPPTE